VATLSISGVIELQQTDRLLGSEISLGDRSPYGVDSLSHLRSALLDRASSELVRPLSRSILQFLGRRLEVTVGEFEGWTTSGGEIESADIELVIHGARQDLIRLIRNSRWRDRWIDASLSPEEVAELEQDLISESKMELATRILNALLG
jgi:hypothetical protein